MLPGQNQNGTAQATWLACDLCGTWRKQQGGEVPPPAADGFTCAVNWDVKYRECGAAQEALSDLEEDYDAELYTAHADVVPAGVRAPPASAAPTDS